MPLAQPAPRSPRPWDVALEGLDGLILLGADRPTAEEAAQEDRLCRLCGEVGLPLLAVDRGLHILNTAFGGSLHMDLARELPQALQHLHLTEPGDRHAVNVLGGTRLASFYGEDEIVVNSEHRRAVQRVARGFRVGANALDGVIESIEAVEFFGWFAMGVQWQPASATASGLDIQLFRGLIDACVNREAVEEREFAAA